MIIKEQRKSRKTGKIMAIYVVKEGDTVDSIAQSENADVFQVIYDNQLVYPYALAVGQALFLEEEPSQILQNIFVSGYAYPFISRWVLEQTLPYLSELPIFSYGFTVQGELIPPQIDESWMIELAAENDVMPVLTLTPLGENGLFNNNLITQVINSEENTNRLIENLVSKMQEKGYQGLDIDFEYILASDRDAFTAFVQKTAERMRLEGYHTSVALAPKTSDDQKGLLYEGKDYEALGEAADHVLLMTYEWGYTYGPPMAVAPLNQVRRVVEYAVTKIQPEKIDLGIPNYGYDWPLPYERGLTKATTINNVQAVRIAVDTGSQILFAPVAQSPWFSYLSENDTEHEVWFEDIRSLQGKFDLVKEFGLRGCGYWQIMQWFRAGWLQLTQNFSVKKQL